MNRFRLVIATFVFWSLGSVALADIVKVAGAAKEIEPPSDIRTGQLENDGVIAIFVEKTDFELPQLITLNISKPGTSPRLIPRTGRKGRPRKPTIDQNLSPTTLSAGRRVNCYYIHCDSVGDKKHSLEGSVTFSEKVLGLITQADGLVGTNAMLGLESTKYAMGAAQSVEMFRDTAITLSPDRRTVTVKLGVDNAADNLRVITDASPAREKNRPRHGFKEVSPEDDGNEVPQEPEKPHKPKPKPPQHAGDLLQVTSVWSGTRTNTFRGHTSNCQVRVLSRDGNVYVLEFKEHHASIRLTMAFRVTGKKMTLVEWKNNSVADFTIENVRAWGSTDGQGMAIEYDWVQSDRRIGRRRGSTQNAPVKGIIEVTRDR